MTVFSALVPSLAFGSEPKLLTLPIVNLPADAIGVRRRIRNIRFMEIFVRRPKGISRHLVAQVEGGLRLVHCQGANLREEVS